MSDHTDKAISAPSRHGSTVGTLLFTLLGPVVWAAHFMTLYFFQSVLCEAESGRGAPMIHTINLVIWLATAIAICTLAAALLAPARFEAFLHTDDWQPEQRAFHRQTMSILSVLSLFAITAGASGTGFIDTCAVLR